MGKSTVGPTFSPSTRSNCAKTLTPTSAAADSAAAAASAAMEAASAARARLFFFGKRVAILNAHPIIAADLLNKPDQREQRSGLQQDVALAGRDHAAQPGACQPAVFFCVSEAEKWERGTGNWFENDVVDVAVTIPDYCQSCQGL
jgi:hypothetical protein